MMRIAINGVGIAGPTLAYWLHRFGHEPLLIERAPQLRSGGYVVDFWGVGYDIAERMGLIPQLRERGYFIQEVRWVNAKGRTSATFDVDIFRQMANNRYVSVERSELAAAIYAAIQGKVETIFGDSIAGIRETDNGVNVTFEHAAPRDFDLVVGADGLHSRVRELVFGPIEDFEMDLGVRVAAFELQGYRPREKDAFVIHTVPGRQISRMSKHNDSTLVLLGFRHRFETGDFPETNEQRQTVIEHAFADVGWESPMILAAMRGADDLYFDRVSQIQMPHWTKGRIALVGDAAACPSLLAGEGAGLGMAEAYVLAGEISRAKNDHATAFDRYEQRLMEFVKDKQRSALKVASTLIPDTQLGIILRNVVTRFLPGRLAVKIGIGSLVDDIELPRYEDEFSNRKTSGTRDIS